MNSSDFSPESNILFQKAGSNSSISAPVGQFSLAKGGRLLINSVYILQVKMGEYV